MARQPYDVVRAHIVVDLTSNNDAIKHTPSYTLIRMPLSKKYKRALGIPETSNALITFMVRNPPSTPTDAPAPDEFDVDVKEHSNVD